MRVCLILLGLRVKGKSRTECVKVDNFIMTCLSRQHDTETVREDDMCSGIYKY
jgi:hypothetical protein